MEHSMYQIGLDSQGVNLQLLENSTQLTTLVAGDSSACTSSFVFEDEGDVFQCGRCKRQFSSLTVFMHHKREECTTVLMSTYGKRVDTRGKTLQDELSKTHFICSSSGHSMTEEVPVNSYEGNSVSELSTAEQIHHQQHSHTEENIISGATPVIHFTPSIVLGEETVSFTIPVDQNSSIAHLVGNNSPQVLSISESELAALISAGERYHISSVDQSNSSITSHSILLTASLMPSHGKETLADSRQYVDISGDNEEQHEDSTFSSHIEEHIEPTNPPLISTKLTPGSREMVNVIRIQKSLPADSLKAPDNIVTKNASNPKRCQSQNHATSIKAATSIRKSQPKKSFPVQNEPSTSEKSKTQASTEVKRKCEFCGKNFKKLFNLHQHIRSHTGEKPFHCLVCGRGFTQKSNVKKHMQTHKVWPKVKYTLPKEQISVKVKDNLEEPVEGDGTDSNVGVVEYIVNNVYVCQYCDLHFENYHKLKTHLSHTHKNEKLYKCIHKDCLATFLEVEGLICHMKSHEDNIEYQCQNCPKKFKTLYDLGAHQHSHRLYPNKISTTAPKQFRCTKCNSKYSSAEALNHHLLTSSHNYPCSQCSLTFVCERYLRRHLRIHGTVEPFRCEKCGKMFKTENYLKSHLVIHSDSKPFHCEICKQSFNRRDKLTRHKLMHDNRRKYKCPFKNTGCEREFYRKDKLKDHMMSHSRKVFVCSKCGKNFSWAARLRQHQAAHHPEMLINTTCPTCQRIFNTKHHLKIHVCKEVEVQNNASESAPKRRTRREMEIERTEIILTGDDSANKSVLYNGCNIEDAMNNSTEKSEDEAMLGSFSHSEDPDAVILTRYSDCEDEDRVISHDTNENTRCIIDPMEITFSSDGQIDPMMAAD